MRIVAVLGVSLLALAACSKKDETAAATGDAAPAAANAPAAPLTPPKRKPGLWAQTVTSAGATQTMKVCLDEATEARLTVWGGQATAEMCPKNVITPAPGGGFGFESECDLGAGGKTVTKGVATGDFKSSYAVKATSVTSGSSMAQANGSHDMEMKGTWEGACPANMKPGDMTLPGGMTVNINQITAMKK